MDGVERRPIDRRGRRRARSRASPAPPARARSPRSARAAPGAAPVSCDNEDGCSSDTGADGTGVPYRATMELLATQVTVVGAGAAGLYTPAVRGPRGRARHARLGHAAGRVRRATGRRAASPRRLRPTTALSRHLADTIAAGRGAVRASAARVLCERGARRGRATSSGSASASTPTANGRLALGLEGGHSRRRIVHAGGGATGRRIVRQLSRGRGRGPEHRRARGPRASSSCSTPDGRCVGVRLDDGRAIASARGRARDGRRRRAVVAHHQPAGRRRRGPAARRRRRRRARRPRARPVPPDGRRRATVRDGFLVTEAIRGEGAHAARRGRRALRRRARAARRGGPGGPAADARYRRARRSTSTCATSTRRGSRTSSPRCARPGIDPDARADTGRARRPLHDGRDRDRPRRPRYARRGSTPSASARAPACTARTGWPRTR